MPIVKCQIDGEDFVNFVAFLKNMNFTFYNAWCTLIQTKRSSVLLLCLDRINMHQPLCKPSKTALVYLILPKC